MPATPIARILRGAALAVLLAATAACEDSPTAPGVYAHPADGRLWTAVAVPEGTPDLGTWLGLLRSQRPAHDPVVERVRTLRVDAEQRYRAGEFEHAQALTEEATALAARSLNAAPPLPVLLGALAALDTWVGRAGAALETAELPELAARVAEVRSLRRAADAALQAGDTAGAVVHLVAAAAEIRDQAPAAVVARALAQAEERIHAEGVESPDATRVLRLLRHAREALAQGDNARALRRALYALQLAEQSGVLTAAVSPATGNP